MRVYSLLTKIISVISVLVAGFFLMTAHASAAPATFTVTSTNDSDSGSLAPSA